MGIDPHRQSPLTPTLNKTQLIKTVSPKSSYAIYPKMLDTDYQIKSHLLKLMLVAMPSLRQNQEIIRISNPLSRMSSKSVENHTANLHTHVNEGERNCNTPKTGDVVRLEMDANKDKTVSPSKKEMNSKYSHQSFLCIPGLQTEPPDSILREKILFQSVRL